jgi:hypothetical protein
MSDDGRGPLSWQRQAHFNAQFLPPHHHSRQHHSIAQQQQQLTQQLPHRQLQQRPLLPPTPAPPGSYMYLIPEQYSAAAAGTFNEEQSLCDV